MRFVVAIMCSDFIPELNDYFIVYISKKQTKEIVKFFNFYFFVCLFVQS